MSNTHNTDERATLMQKLSALSYEEKAVVIAQLNKLTPLSREERLAIVDMIIKQLRKERKRK